MTLRRLNAAGLVQLNSFLDSLGSATPLAAPMLSLTDPATSEAVGTDADIKPRTFETRFELAAYLNKELTDAGLSDSRHDVGLWAWLALYYVDQLCPPDKTGRRHPGERARWIPAVNEYRKYYRHLIAGPYWIYRAHRDNPFRVFALLAGPPDKPGDLAEQLASRQEIVTNNAVMELATALYIDRRTQRPKQGAASRGSGSVRRLVDVLNQYDLTWDLYSLETKGLLELLPVEFNRFRPGK